MNIIFISELANPAVFDYMNTLGTVIKVPGDDRFDIRIRSHPDLVISIVDNTLVIDEHASVNLFKQLDALKVPYVTGSSDLAAAYPLDVAYNAVITEDCFIHNLDHTAPLVLAHCRNQQKQLIHVRQGYTKCSSVVVNEKAVITADRGIYHAAKDHLNVLLVQPGHVLLDGYDSGFLGGTSGVIGETVIFHGNLRQHPDYDKIMKFLEAAGKTTNYFEEFLLTDIGSILVLQYQTDSEGMNSSGSKQMDHTGSEKPNVDIQKHVNIPVFISHEGCPNDCVFCNQRKITASVQAMTLAEVTDQIRIYLSTLDDKTYVELAFFGGSFTGIDPVLQENYLELAAEYKKTGRIQAIRLSTRPDYISREVLNRLRHYNVDTIELGVQSLDDTVLKASNRGHQVSDVYAAVALIKAYGFQLGLQLMVGLPEDTKPRAVLSAKLTALLKPDFVRIYPTLVIRDTALAEQCTQGSYLPLSVEEAVDWTKDMYRVFLSAHIPVIRIGLQPTDLIAEGKEVLSGPFHPAFRQLVESAYFLELIESKLYEPNSYLSKSSDIKVLCNPKDLSQVIGHKRSNLLALMHDYPKLQVIPNKSIKPMELELLIHNP